MADTEFKGKLVEASPFVRPDIITDPEENKRRAAMWNGVHRKHRKPSWVELTDYAEKRCDFTPEYDIDDGITYSDNFYCEDCEAHFEGLEADEYDTMDYSTPEQVTSLEIPMNTPIRPFGKVKIEFEEIKYGDGLNKFWRVNAHCSLVKEQNKHERCKKAGNLTKEQCPFKKRGRALSDEELLERAKGTGYKARNARRELKRRGVV